MSLLYTPCPNKITEIMTGYAINQFIEGCGYDDDPEWDGNEVRDYFDRMVEDYPDQYEEEWFSIASTKGIANAVDWKWIAEHLTIWYKIYDGEDGQLLSDAWCPCESEDERKQRMEREAYYSANGLQI